MILIQFYTENHRGAYSSIGYIMHEAAGFTKCGVYSFAVFVKYYDNGLMEELCFRSPYLFIDLQIDPNPVAIHTVEVNDYIPDWGSDISFKGDIFTDSIYKIESYGNKNEGGSGEGGFPKTGGVYTATNIKDYENFVTIQRYYDFSVSDRTLQVKMTLPQEPPIDLRDWQSVFIF